MQMNQSAFVRSLIKFPLMALLGFAAVDAVLPSQSLAGTVPVVPQDSSNAVGDTFAPPAPPAIGDALAVQIANNILSTLQTIRNTNSVTSVTGETLFITDAKVDAITALLSSDRTNSDIEILERYIFEETSGQIQVDLSALGTSQSDVITAAESLNSFFDSLTSEQLALAIESPTIMALWQLLNAADEVLEGYIVNFPGGGTASLFTILLLN